jgi:hypothetical protein
MSRGVRVEQSLSIDKVNPKEGGVEAPARTRAGFELNFKSHSLSCHAMTPISIARTTTVTAFDANINDAYR